MVKTITCNIDGVPDVIACKPDGKFIAIEVKTPRGKVEPLQQYQINKINKVGGVAVVARSLEDVTALF